MKRDTVATCAFVMALGAIAIALGGGTAKAHHPPRAMPGPRYEAIPSGPVRHARAEPLLRSALRDSSAAETLMAGSSAVFGTLPAARTVPVLGLASAREVLNGAGAHAIGYAGAARHAGLRRVG